jgi:hypothetical protein
LVGSLPRNKNGTEIEIMKLIDFERGARVPALSFLVFAAAAGIGLVAPVTPARSTDAATETGCLSDPERPAITCFESAAQDYVNEAWQAPLPSASSPTIEDILEAEEKKNAGASPVLVVPKDGRATVETSLDQWTAYQRALEQEKIDELRRLAPGGVAMPKLPAAGASPVDLWSKTDIKDSALQSQVEGYASELGAKLKIDSNVVVGARADIEEEGPAHIQASGTRNNGYLVGPNVGVSLGPKVSVGAYSAWGERHTSDAATANNASEQAVREAGVNAQIDIGRVKLLPKAAYVHEETTTVGGTDPGSAAVSGDTVSSRLELTPEIRRPIELEDGKVIEPFVNFTSSLGLEQGQAQESQHAAPVDKVGVGVAVSKAEEYKLEATTDVDNMAESENRNVNSRLKLTVPLD